MTDIERIAMLTEQNEQLRRETRQMREDITTLVERAERAEEMRQTAAGMIGHYIAKGAAVVAERMDQERVRKAIEQNIKESK